MYLVGIVKNYWLKLWCGEHLPNLPFQGREPIGRNNTIVFDAWPVRRQAYYCLPNSRASLPFGRYQIKLLGDRGTRVRTTCSLLSLTAMRPGITI